MYAEWNETKVVVVYPSLEPDDEDQRDVTNSTTSKQSAMERLKFFGFHLD